MHRYFLSCLLGLFTTSLLAATAIPQDFLATTTHKTLRAKHWGLLVYHSWMTADNLGPLITGREIHFKYGTMDSIDLSYQLSPQNPLRRFFQPLVSTVEVSGNFTQRNDPNGLIYEFDPYLNFRWAFFPWDKVVTTTFAIGDGLSYATKPPLREQYDSTTHNAKHLLNFLVLEASFAIPKHPNLQLVVRIHHRCGAWGLFGAGNLSSNAVGVGIRYVF